MAIINGDELISKVSAIIGDRKDDEALGVLEDVSDTIRAYSEAEDWRIRYEENDANWRKKYRERFENGPVEETNVTEMIPKEMTEEERDKTISELFN